MEVKRLGANEKFGDDFLPLDKSHKPVMKYAYRCSIAIECAVETNFCQIESINEKWLVRIRN